MPKIALLSRVLKCWPLGVIGGRKIVLACAKLFIFEVRTETSWALTKVEKSFFVY